MDTNELKKLYLQYTGHLPEQMQPLTPAGSNRRYFRLGLQPTLIGVVGESKDENRAFLYMAEFFKTKGLPVPRVLAHSDDGLLYLQEDLGDTLLFDAIIQGRTSGIYNETEQNLLHKTIALLPILQMEGANMDFSYCYPQPELNRRSILWDLNYFKYCYLKATGINFQEDKLEDDFQQMADLLPGAGIHAFMYRDFQSRNVMLKNGEQPWFIDFQGGRKGPVYYDVASFLWQAKANYPDELREALLHTYLKTLEKYQKVDEGDFRKRLRHFVLFRNLQVLGAYGFRGYFERKPHFLESIPFALRNLCKLLQNPFPEYPYLTQILQRLAEPTPAPTKETMELTVRITSFSYKKGIPADPSGNGGGYVFDCRALHNPGRYERYQKLNGLDEPVIRFLEDDGEILSFLEHVYALVDASVARYLERGFSNLSVCFGCTGGQHRSVYAAQHLAEHLHQKYNVRIELEHREQSIKTILQPNKQL